MLEMYAFVAAFAAQILIVSVLGPLRLVGSLRVQIARFIAERAPPIDPLAAESVDRKLRLFRALGLCTAVVGLLLLIPIVRYMLRPDWHDGPLEAVVPIYWLAQVLPLFLATLTAGRFHEVLKRSLPEQKRTATLQRRGLFDFVSRSAVALAILVYFLYVALLLYIERHPFPGFAGLFTNLLGMTIIYAAMALAIYMTLRTRGSSPLQARDDRMRSVGLAVKVSVYSCILLVAFLAHNMLLILLDQQRWEPFFLSISLVVMGLLSFMALREQLRITAVGNPASAAGTR